MRPDTASSRCAPIGYVRGRPLLERLGAIGLTTPAGRKLSLDTMYWMLRNPVYAGYVRAADWGHHRGDFEALVSEETFARAQAQLDAPWHGSRLLRRAPRSSTSRGCWRSPSTR